MKFRTGRVFVLAAVVATVFIIMTMAGPALAQEPDFDRINTIAKELNCPTCAGINLADCRTLTCQQWRDQIADLVAQGYTDQEVLDYFSSRYGIQVLQEPPRSGSTLILWVLPVVAVVAGLGLLAYTVRSWSRRGEPAAQGATPEAVAEPDAPILAETNVSDDYLKEVEQDLERGG